MTAGLAAILWVLAATVTALLPYRRQFAPGIALLVLAPVLIVWIGTAHGWIWGGVALVAFLSMFRNPLIHLGRRLAGLPARLLPDDWPGHRSVELFAALRDRALPRAQAYVDDVVRSG